MIAAFLLALREGIEIALILGIVLGALRKTQRSEYQAAVWSGAAAAGLLSLGIAVGLNRVGSAFEGRGEEIFEGIMMLLAAGVLTWMIFWMQQQARHIKVELEADVRRASLGGRGALFSLAFVAVFREGIELALFLTAAGFATSPVTTLTGAVAGLATAALLGWALFAATVRLNLRSFFRVTSVLLILFAAGLAAHGVHELNEAGLIPAVIDPVWNTNGVINETSVTGVLLATLFGYNGNPSLTEVMTYFAYLTIVGLWVWRSSLTAQAYQPAQ